jgi:hypothetical protein
MKTSIRNLMLSGVCFVTLLSGAAMAGTEISKPKPNTPFHNSKGFGIEVQISQLVNSETIRMIIDNPENKRITLTLSDITGTFISRVVSGKYEKKVVRDFDFKEAEEGIYYIDIFDGHNDVRKQIRLQRIHQNDLTKLSVQ